MNRGYYKPYIDAYTITRWKDKFDTPKGTDLEDRCLCTTGSTDRNNSLNIYDFAGNLSEWTLERHSYINSPCVHRGGHYYYESGNYASSRTYSLTYMPKYDYEGNRSNFF